MPRCDTIFITGTGRSGTNVLKEILSLHPDVYSLPFEYRFTVDPRGILEFYNTFPAIWTPYWADARLKDLEDFLMSLAEKSPVQHVNQQNVSPEPYQDWELNKWIPGYENYVRELIEQLVQFNYPARWPGTKGGIENNKMYFASSITKQTLKKPLEAFLAKCFNAMRKAHNKQVFIEDNTHSFLFADDLESLVPNGKMIHIVRDPRDVIASLVNQRWAPQNLNNCITWYSETMSRWLDIKEKLSPEFYLEIKFEDLVENLESILEKIGAKTNLSVEQQMVSFDLSANNIGRYSTQFSKSQREELNRSLNRYMSEYHYV